MALSCHLSMDLVCQEMRDAWWPLVHCVPEGRRCSDAQVPSFNVRPGLEAGDRTFCAFFGVRAFLHFVRVSLFVLCIVQKVERGACTTF